MATYYQISLKPLAPYFFGQGTNAELGNKQNYFQHSAFMPSQTTLLGMLRYHLLLKKGWAFPQINKSSKDEIENLIGYKGFIPSSNNQYGVINKISPVFITKNNEGQYFFGNKLFVGSNPVEERSGPGLSFGSTEDANKNWVLNMNNNPLTAKDEFSSYFLDFGDINKKIAFDEVITDVLLTGNTKTAYRKHLSDDEAYFRFNHQEFVEHILIKEIPTERRKYRRKNLNNQYALENEYKFSFYVELTEDELADGYKDVILIGKEQSPFQMEVKKLQDQPNLFASNGQNATGNRIWLLSDLFVKDSTQLKAKSSFICADALSSGSFTKPNDISNNKWSYHKPEINSYSLYAKGGIIYSEKISELNTEVFGAATDWQNIGYNYFKTI